MERDRVNKMIGLWHKHNRNLPAYAWPGGYPIVYYDNDGSPLCASCASEALAEFLKLRKESATGRFGPMLYDYYSDLPQYSDIFYEGPTVFCAECNEEMESAYGDPWAEEEDNDGHHGN